MKENRPNFKFVCERYLKHLIFLMSFTDQFKINLSTKKKLKKQKKTIKFEFSLNFVSFSVFHVFKMIRRELVNLG